MAFGDLVPGRGGWVEQAPTHCPNGHELGANRVLVGHVGCSCGQRGGHRTWWCREPGCGATVYGPPLSAVCRLATGPDER